MPVGGNIPRLVSGGSGACYKVLTSWGATRKLCTSELFGVLRNVLQMLPTTEAFATSRGLLRLRDGTNPIERKAVYRAQLEIKSMPASLVVQIALWPDKLADWAKETAVAPSVVYNMLANVKPYHRVRSLLARRLNVPKDELDHLIEAPRPEPLAKLPPEPPAAVPPAHSSPPPAASSSVVPERSIASPTAGGESLAPPARRRAVRREVVAPPASQTALNL